MFSRAILVAALLPTALAFQNSNPIIAWSSHSSSALSSTSKSTQTDKFIESLVLDDSICENDAVFLVDQMGLHASDLRSLPASSSLVRIINAAPSSVELPYMRRSTENPLEDLASAISRRCGSRILGVSPGELAPHLDNVQDTPKKHVICMGMSAVEGMGSQRKHMMGDHGTRHMNRHNSGSLIQTAESRLSEDLKSIASAFPKHLVVYAGWSPAAHQHRQFYEEDDDVDFDLDDYAMASETPTIPSTRKAAPSGGILKRYQLLTPGLIVCLFVVLFVLLPVLYMSVSALASIQSSVRLDAPKGFDAMRPVMLNDHNILSTSPSLTPVNKMVFCFPCKRSRKNFDDHDDVSASSSTLMNKSKDDRRSSRIPPPTVTAVEKSSAHPRIAIIIYSMYGHIATMAESVKSGIEKAGGKATIYQ
ncbi:hypothetical protein NM688_g6170 [Phlebia brevispora]|uniref:Uncharacterized protein n=1 Tax=Phlebia brevispora TaxID=194682 RepID=A0ACC1SJE8_9APHY|nr:hypothetical protein NM688_g6170 [Phlebia brevispora]